MNASTESHALELIQQAYRALRANDRTLARTLAGEAANLAPELEDPWLILSALATPKASLEYAEKALALAPGSPKALRALDWAKKRLEQAQPVTPAEVTPQAAMIQPEAAAAVEAPEQVLRAQIEPEPTRPERKKRSSAWLWVISLVGIALVAAGIWGWSSVGSALAKNASERPAGILIKPSLTPTETPTATATRTATATATQTASRTPTVTASFTSTSTSTGTKTATAKPTLTRAPATKANTVVAPPQGVKVPAGIQAGEHWIDVDISKQRAYAYEGSTLVRSFVVSTGIAAYPTVTGTYRIYVKYRYAPMSGVGWYLPNVPYVMYFYKGYGLHGTYWHNNFGTPMSHGCINFKTDDAAWVYGFTVVGSVVNLHY